MVKQVEQEFFRGTFQIKVDDKGRMSLPSTYKESSVANTNEFVFTNSMYQGRPCLDLYTKAAWNELEQKIAKLPQLKKEVQSFQRFYLAAGQSIEIDAQGRVLIPKSFREFAKIEGDVVLLGMGGKIEIWSHSYWEAVHNNLSETFEATLNSLSDIEGAA